MQSTVFSGRAKDYANFRVDYPEAIRDHLVKDLKLKSSDVVADVGSGTGLLSKWFLELGSAVYGVEPNEDMRNEGEKNLAAFKNFTSIEGSAEQTNLPDQSVDLIAAGNAFHWFHPERARKEFQRILKSDGRVFLVRTDWKEFPAERMKEYDQIILRYCIGRGGVISNPNLEKEMIREFFSKFRESTLCQSETPYTCEQLKGRFLSTSFSPKSGHPKHEEAMKDLETLFQKYEVNGKFSFGVLTTVIHGLL